MAAPILIQEKTDPSRFIEWQGTNGIPEVARVKVPTATSVIVTVDTVQTVLPASPQRNRVILQNVSAQPIYVKFGAGASAADFSVVLQGGTAANDGKGGLLVVEGYTGLITALAASGVGVQIVATQY